MFRFAVFMVLASTACARPTDTKAPAAPGETAPAGATGGSGAPTQSRAPADASGVSLFVVHHVSDFDAFQRYFAEGESTRRELGVEGYLLSRLEDGSGRVVIHFLAPTLEQVRRALDSQQVQEMLARDGAPDASLVWLAHNEVLLVPDAPPSEVTYSWFAKFPVAEFEAFEAAFLERRPVLSEHHVIAYGLHRSEADPGVVILHLTGTHRDELFGIADDPRFSDLLRMSSKSDEVRPLLAVDVARGRAP